MIKPVSRGNAPHAVAAAAPAASTPLAMEAALVAVRGAASRSPALTRSRSAECLSRPAPSPIRPHAWEDEPPRALLAAMLVNSAHAHRCSVRGNQEEASDHLDLGFDVCVDSTLSAWTREYDTIWHPTCDLIHQLFLDLARHLNMQGCDAQFRAFQNIFSRYGACPADDERLQIKLRHSLRAPCERLAPRNIELLLDTLQARRPYWLLGRDSHRPSCIDALIHRLLTFLQEQGRPDIDIARLITENFAAYERGGR
jgi:hypothetical protein